MAPDVLDSYTAAINPIASGVWSHLLVSVDLATDSVDVYVNDVNISSSFTKANIQRHNSICSFRHCSA